jgi:hypothetical protein
MPGELRVCVEFDETSQPCVNLANQRLDSWLQDTDSAHEALLKAIDRQGFSWWIYFVAAVGFFTDAYDLFAVNLVQSALAAAYSRRCRHCIYLFLFCLQFFGTSVRSFEIVNMLSFPLIFSVLCYMPS